MAEKEPTKLTLTDVPLGHVDWNMSDNNLLLVSGENKEKRTILLARMAQQVKDMGGSPVTVNMEHGSKFDVQQYSQLKRLQKTLQNVGLEAFRRKTSGMATDRTPIVVFIDDFDHMMSHYDEYSYPAKATRKLNRIQGLLESIVRWGATVNVGVVLAGRRLDATVPSLKERMRTADRIRVTEHDEMLIENGDIDLNLTLKNMDIHLIEIVEMLKNLTNSDLR